MLVTDYAIRFRTAVFVAILLFAALGGISYVVLPREGMPDITIPHVFVTAVYEGTAPLEIEQLITIPLEKELNNVEGLKETRSVSSENVSFIDIEFLAGEDIDQAKQRVKDKVDLARPDLPADLDEPVVQALNVSSDIPIFKCALSGGADLERLTDLAERLQDRIEAVAGVKAAEIYGAREREIRVEVDPGRLAAYDIPLGLVMRRIAEENATVSAGNIEMAGSKFQVRIPGEFVLSSELPRILILERGGRPVYLSDIAAVRDAYKDVESVSRLDGEPSVSLGVKKRAGENSVALIRRVKTAMAEVPLPPGIRRTDVFDESEYVQEMIGELENNIVTGSLLVVAVLVVFMGGRNSVMVSLAIPLSMLIGFMVLAYLGQSMNMIVLFALVLASGMLVDNAIVIVENIYRHHAQGLPRLRAAIRGAREVAWPVTTSTLTTVAAFLPLLFWPGIMGQFMGFLPKTVIIVLLASLFVGLVINPAVCAALVGVRRKDRADPRTARRHPFMSGYERVLRGALRHPAAVLTAGVLALVVTVQLYARFGRGFELFPEIQPRNATVKVKFPQGTSLARTDAALRLLEQRIGRHDDVRFLLATAGAAGGFSFAGGAGDGSHLGNIHIEFAKYAQRRGSTTELVDRLRAAVGVIPGADVLVEKEREGPPTGAPVSIEVSGEDFERLGEAADRIQRAIATVPGLVDLETDLEEALPELQFRVDRRRAALLGLDTRAIGEFLRTAIHGTEASRLRADEDEFDITVRLPEGERSSAALLDRVFMPVPGGRSVPLAALGSVTYTGGRGAIRHKDGKRMAAVMGNNQGRGVDAIIADVRERIAALRLPPGFAVAYAGDTREMQESGAFLFQALLAALGLILLILVVEFNSVLLPGIILVSVVLSVAGVMWGLLAWGMRFGVIMTGLGVVSLAGVVVNNSIVLIDCIEQRRREGLDPVEAAVQAGLVRLRPVLLTAGTTILGLIPMVVGYGLEIHEFPPRIVSGAESTAWWAPMAVAVMAGLGAATVLTLVQVPVMYTLADALVRDLRWACGGTAADPHHGGGGDDEAFRAEAARAERAQP